MYKQFVSRTVLTSLIVSLVATLTFAQTEPTFEIGEPQFFFDETISKQVGLAVNTQEPELLLVTIDTYPIGNDPFTDELAAQSVIGQFVDPTTLEKMGDEFTILGNSIGTGMEELTIAYNPVSNQYMVSCVAKPYQSESLTRALERAGADSNTSVNIPQFALVNSYATANSEDPVAKQWLFDFDADETWLSTFDDTGVTASTINGNYLWVVETQLATEDGEGVIAVMYDKDGNRLNPKVTRLDVLEQGRDEDDPEVRFSETRNVFLMTTNIDPSNDVNRLTVTVMLPDVDANHEIVFGDQKILGTIRSGKEGMNHGHPDLVELPGTGETLLAFDYANGSDGGDLIYFDFDANDLSITETRTQIPYFEAAGNNPFSHRHPHFAIDLNSGVIALVHNAQSGSYQGMVFTLLDLNGDILPGRPDDLYKLVATDSAVSNSAFFHDTKYDPTTDSFIVVYNTSDGFTNLINLKITSDHRPADVSSWSLY
jgi:hypothetical protein